MPEGQREGHGIFNLQGSMDFNIVMTGMTKLEMVGGFFTWCNGYGKEHIVGS